MRRIPICVAVAMAFSLAFVAVAGAVTYRGGGTDDPKVRVSFEKDKRVIKRFTVRQARFFCTDGDRFRGTVRVGRMHVNREKRFFGAFTNPTGTRTARVHGRLMGRRAIGQMRSVAFFDSVRCTTRQVDWRARRPPRR